MIIQIPRKPILILQFQTPISMRYLQIFASLTVVIYIMIKGRSDIHGLLWWESGRKSRIRRLEVFTSPWWRDMGILKFV